MRKSVTYGRTDGWMDGDSDRHHHTMMLYAPFEDGRYVYKNDAGYNECKCSVIIRSYEALP